MPQDEEERIEPPWAAPIVAPKPNSVGTSQLGTLLWSAPWPTPPTKPSSSLDNPEHMPKPVIASDEATPAKPVIKDSRKIKES